MLLPLQGVRILSIHIPRALPWAMCLWAFSPYYYYFKNNYLQQIKTVSKIIIFNKTNFFWDFELIHSKWTGKYKLIYSKENKKGEYAGSVEKEFAKPETVIKNIKKLIEK